VLDCRLKAGDSFFVGEERAMAKKEIPEDSFFVRHSFVVRIWQDAYAGQSRWGCWVQHVRSGDSASVQSVDELMAFIKRRTGKLEGPGTKGLK
jgi:hypothetical protein